MRGTGLIGREDSVRRLATAEFPRDVEKRVTGLLVRAEEVEYGQQVSIVRSNVLRRDAKPLKPLR